MKKQIMKVAIVAVFGLIVGYTAYNSQKDELALSEVLLDNVEALANENSGSYNCCNGCKGAFCGTFYPAGSMSGVSMYYKI